MYLAVRGHMALQMHPRQTLFQQLFNILNFPTSLVCVDSSLGMCR